MTEIEGDEIRFYDLEIRREWWAHSSAIPTGTFRFASEAGRAFVAYEVSAWPGAPIILGVGSAFVLAAVLNGEPHEAMVLAPFFVVAPAVQFGASLWIVRWFLRRTMRKTGSWTGQ